MWNHPILWKGEAARTVGGRLDHDEEEQEQDSASPILAMGLWVEELVGSSCSDLYVLTNEASIPSLLLAKVRPWRQRKKKGTNIC